MVDEINHWCAILQKKKKKKKKKKKNIFKKKTQWCVYSRPDLNLNKSQLKYDIW